MDELLAGLTEAQRVAVTSDGAPLVILAGAGSGKTRVLTRRIAWRVAEQTADARHVLALTFTRKAAGELRSRLDQLGVRGRVRAGTFHATAYAELRTLWRDRDERPRALVTRKINLLTPLMITSEAARRFDAAAEIEWAKARRLSPEEYRAVAEDHGRTPPGSVADMARLYERYELAKREQHAVDFEDLVLRCADEMVADSAFAARQRWQYRHLFVDEFQDLNPAQAALLDAWRGGRDDLCVVGDPNQAIYGWNGAEPSYLTNFTTREPGATVVRLDEAFRSSPQILAVASSVLGPSATAVAARGDGQLPRIDAYDDEHAEAEGVARRIARLRAENRSWSSIAVLARTNAQLVLVQQALIAARVPCTLKGGSAFLRRPAVREALSDLRLAPGQFRERVAWLRDRAESASDDDVREVVRIAEEYADEASEPTVAEFDEWVRAVLADDEGPVDSPGVELATFHAAKGLEWPTVFVVGLEAGFVPMAPDDRPDLDEDRRLLYVALTRAEDELHCSWARKRRFGDRRIPRKPSPWLDDIRLTIDALQQGLAPADLRDRVAEQRRKLVRVGSGADPALLEALKAWRRGESRTSGVPPHVIFHDTTLAAVAEARPQDREALLRLPGLGPVKAARYGDDLLRVVAEAIAS